MIPETRRPWDGRVRVRMANYFGIGDDPQRLACMKRRESRLYALEEFERLRRSDASAAAGSKARP